MIFYPGHKAYLYCLSILFIWFTHVGAETGVMEVKTDQTQQVQLDSLELTSDTVSFFSCHCASSHNHSHIFVLQEILQGNILGSSVAPRIGNGYGNGLSLDNHFLAVASPNASFNGITNAGAIYFIRKFTVNTSRCKRRFL